MYFRSFPFYHVSSHMLLNREIHNRAVLDLYKYIVWGSMKRDCPSLICYKTQYSFHFFFFFLGHTFGEAFDVYIAYGLFAPAIVGDVFNFAAIVAFGWGTSGGGFIHIHCIFVFNFDRDCFRFWFRRSSLCICGSDLLFESEFFSSEKLCRFPEGLFQFCGTIIPSLELSGCHSVSQISCFNYLSS